jgi:hypothetical protein
MASHFTDDDSHREPAGKSSSPTILLQFVGMIPADDLQKMSDAIEAGCERIDSEEWSGSR